MFNFKIKVQDIAESDNIIELTISSNKLSVEYICRFLTAYKSLSKFTVSQQIYNIFKEYAKIYVWTIPPTAPAVAFMTEAEIYYICRHDIINLVNNDNNVYNYIPKKFRSTFDAS
jgi:hypothetical protein